MAKRRKPRRQPGPPHPRPPRPDLPLSPGAKDRPSRLDRPPRPGAQDRPSRPDRLRQHPVGGTPGIVRGASWGFSILLVGELVAVLLLGLGNGLVLYVVAAAAYAMAGNRAVQPPVTSVSTAARDGALAAALAYALTIPLRFIDHSATTSVVVTAVALGFALVIGGLAGAIVGRARLQEQGRPED